MTGSVLRRSVDVNILLAGQAGQGIQTLETILTRVLNASGYHVHSTREIMSRIRGGQNSTTIRVSSKPVRAALRRADLLVPLHPGSLNHVKDRMDDETLVMGDAEVLFPDGNVQVPTFVDIPFKRLAGEMGNPLFANVMVAGAVASFLGVEEDILGRFLESRFSSKGKDITEGNVKAALRGMALGREQMDRGRLVLDIPRDDSTARDIMMTGTESVALGAMAGGCNFLASYPMSPATGVMSFLARNGGDLGMVVEQTEDEVAALNMVLGAWYAGARGLVTTSGGGFALMEEAMSLSGVMEMPAVIHLSQRPGPGTGLPTRTEQGDLELVLHSGHGTFPRFIFAPGTMEEAFELTIRAFDMADRFQVPAVILTDQYFVDMQCNLKKLGDVPSVVDRHFIKAGDGYRRYEITPDGVSPRGVPGYGGQPIVADSHEHDQDGHINEDLDLRVRMVDKRLAKERSMIESSSQPELTGPDDHSVLVISWGSTGPVVAEALGLLDRDDTAHMHFTQLWPLPSGLDGTLGKADRVIVVEGNPTGQFADLLQNTTGVPIPHRLLKYTGIQFYVEEVLEGVNGLLSEGGQ